MPPADRERIAKVLARAGIASRRDAEKIIAEGRIKLNGAIVSRPATLVGAADRLMIDNRPVPIAQPTRLWRYHKPAGLVTTARDPQGRPTVFAALPKALPRVVAVGRLDLNTEGLLLLTNDGKLARYLEHPANEFPRTYRVRVHGNVNSEVVARLDAGMIIDGVRYRPAHAVIDHKRGANCWITIKLTEGKNREIRRLMQHFNLAVTRLIRIGYGPFILADLPRSEVEEVPASALRRLMPSYFAEFGREQIGGSP